jgi:hypothetical protein
MSITSLSAGGPDFESAQGASGKPAAKEQSLTILQELKIEFRHLLEG